MDLVAAATSNAFSLSSLSIVLLVIFLAVHIIRIHFRSHLREIPGPLLSSISPLPRLLSVARGHAHFDTLTLHRLYGPLVRVGPNHVSFADGEALPVVYSAYSKFEKSDFYVPFDAKTASHGFVPTVFSVRSETAHRGIKRPIAGAYSMTTLLELEGVTDECIALFEQKIEEKIVKSQSGGIEIDLGEWLHWYAFDLITSITFSNRLGFMEREMDVEGIIAAIEGRLKYNATIGQWPSLHKYLLGNRFVSWVAGYVPGLKKLNTAGRIVEFAAADAEAGEQSSWLCGYARPVQARQKRRIGADDGHGCSYGGGGQCVRWE